MRTIFIILIFFGLSKFSFGQIIYQADREAYKLNKFTYEFYLFNDSTCFLKGNTIDNSIYFLYKGRLKKRNDTLYEFKFQPIVNFGCNKRFETGDSLRFHISQIDTAISFFTYKVKTSGNRETSLTLNSGWTTVTIKNAREEIFLIDTKFIDPLTNKLIYLTVDILSEPDLTYYGSNTDFGTIEISLINNKMTIYPDEIFIQDQDEFIMR